ncbi:hypothetical protein N7520_011290 [Penicillium odoratum]|uniref:uncharacterized protein n=1 Tax=Penicillium odoratum TaxID=1167516 RepID=UPI0025487FC6|nr:uncharacterized protein N7520_011290 [Penicillium odoratum]KAJ5746108.1 hypothetical protein N7520_011290 [Penicillium odoratum]
MSVISPFAQAIDEYLHNLKLSDRENPFYKEVLLSRSVLALGEKPNGTQQCADELLEFVKTLETQKRSSGSIKVLERLQPFVNGLQGMLEACQVLLNASPFSVGVAFVGAKLVLGLAQKTNAIFEEISDAMSEIGNSLMCYAKISLAYETSNEVRACLVASYKNIVTFWATAAKILSQNVLLSTIKKAFTPLSDIVGQTVKTLRRDCNRVMDIAQAEEAVHSNEDRKRAKAEQERQLREGIFNWISAGDDLDVRSDLQVNSDRRHGKTGTWLFKNPQFQRWSDKNSPDNIFWYNAPPGSGKTVLSSTVVTQFSDKGLPTACFFYSFNDFKKREPLTGLRALAFQLLNMLKTGIPDRVIELYKEELARHEPKMRLPGLVIEVLHQLLKQCPLVYLIVDGLDECSDDRTLCRLLSDITSAPVYGTTKWFFASRPDGEIKGMMKQLKALTISPPISTLRAEIRCFLADGLETVTTDMDEIENFVDYSEGSFLYSQFLLNTLRGEGVTCDDDITEALNGFPKGLSGFYMRSLLKLCDKTDGQQDLVRRIFIILSVARKSITWNELCNALAIRRGASDHSAGRQPHEEQVYRLCGSLLSFDRSSKGSEHNPTVKFYHKTISDFLRQNPDDLLMEKSFSQDQHKFPLIRKFFIDPISASAQIGLDCVTLLQYQRYKSFKDIPNALGCDKIEDAFLKYAASFWHIHLFDKTNNSRETFWEVQRFMQSPNFWTCIAVQSYTAPFLFGRYAEVSDGCYLMGLRREDLNGDYCFGVPLPSWVKDHCSHGLEMDNDFCSFLHDWHEVLASRPGALDQCVPLRAMKSKLGTNFHHSERIRIWRASEKMHLEDVSNLHFSSVTLSKGKLFVDLVTRQSNEPSGLCHYHRVPIFCKDSKFHEGFNMDLGKSNSDSNSDSGYDGQHENPCGKAEDPEKIATEWAIIALDPFPPVWIPLALGNRHRGGVAYAIHPSSPMIILDSTDGQTIIANLDTGNWHIAKDLIDAEDPGTAILSQQLRFSPDGKFLHSLRASFTQEPNNSTCQLTLSTRPFIEDSKEKDLPNALSSSQQHIVYKFSENLESLSSDFFLAHWGDKEVVVALPSLTCEPKFIKFDLRQTRIETNSDEVPVQTLINPIYFPSSTVKAHPILLYRHRTSPKDHEMFLCLTQRTEPSKAQLEDEEIEDVTSSPVVIRWKIPHGRGWRAWDSESDGVSEDLRSDMNNYKALRGAFVDGDREFTVPIRSGLNWTRNAFLSCS